jgi:hypothetical protein
LQNGRALTFAQMRQQDDFSVRELEGVTMDARLTLVDLSKLRNRVPEPPKEDKSSLASYLFLEGKLRTGKQTDGHTTIVDRGKATRNRLGEARCYQLVSDLRGAGRDKM